MIIKDFFIKPPIKHNEMIRFVAFNFLLFSRCANTFDQLVHVFIAQDSVQLSLSQVDRYFDMLIRLLDIVWDLSVLIPSASEVRAEELKGILNIFRQET